MYRKKIILLTFVNRHWSKYLIDRHVTSYSFFDFVISSCSIIRQEKTKNKNITRNKNDEYMSKVEICWCKKCRLFDSFHHLFSDFQSEFHLIVNDLHRMFVENSNSFDLQSRQIKSLFSHIFDTCNLNYVLNFEISYKFALRHVSMRQFYLLSKRSNSKYSNLHMLAKVFRANSRFSIHVSEFSKIVYLDSICKRCQEHFVIYLSNSWFTLIVSKTESNKIFMKISTLRKCWSEEVTKVVCFFEFLISVSEKLIWKNLICCCFSCFARLFHSINRWTIMIWKSVKVCCFIDLWEFDCFFVVASSWFSTITHLFSISLSNDKYEKERNNKYDQTWQYSFEKAYCTIKKKTRCVTIQFRKNVLYSYSNESVSMMYF